MQFNELLEQYSIKEISQRTRVAPENIEHLQGGDWEMMRKVQALGFINIIEREFGVDLSGLRKECLEYYRGHDQGLGGEKYDLHADSKSFSPSNILPKILISLLIIAVLVGSWYTFVQKNPDFTAKNEKSKKEGFYDSAMKVAKNIIENNKDNADEELSLSKNSDNEAKDKEASPTPTESKQDESENKKNIESNSEEDKKIKLEYAQKPQENNETQESKTAENRDTNKKDDTTKALKITDVIPVSTTVSNTSEQAKEESSNEKLTNNTNNQIDNKKDESIGDNNIEVVSLLPEVPSLSKNSDDKKVKTTNENTQEKKATTGSATVILTPRSKVWIGFRELRSGKRTAEVVQKDQAITFDTTKSDYILATGHGVLTFTNGDDKELLKLHDGKKHFFMIAKGGVREISHEKFQKLNGSKVW